MSFKYCRVYSWPNSSDNWPTSEAYYEKLVNNAETLETKLPCNFVIMLAYERSVFPFVSIALDMDYHSVANSDISQILDKYISDLGDPKPTSVENPAWFASVDGKYLYTLNHYGVILVKSAFYKKVGGASFQVYHYSENEEFIPIPDDPMDNSSLNKNENITLHPSKKWWQIWK